MAYETQSQQARAAASMAELAADLDQDAAGHPGSTVGDDLDRVYHGLRHELPDNARRHYFALRSDPATKGFWKGVEALKELCQKGATVWDLTDKSLQMKAARDAARATAQAVGPYGALAKATTATVYTLRLASFWFTLAVEALSSPTLDDFADLELEREWREIDFERTLRRSEPQHGASWEELMTLDPDRRLTFETYSDLETQPAQEPGTPRPDAVDRDPSPRLDEPEPQTRSVGDHTGIGEHATDDW